MQDDAHVVLKVAHSEENKVTILNKYNSLIKYGTFYKPKKVFPSINVPLDINPQFLTPDNYLIINHIDDSDFKQLFVFSQWLNDIKNGVQYVESN